MNNCHDKYNDNSRFDYLFRSLRPGSGTERNVEAASKCPFCRDVLNISEVQALPDFDSFVVSVNNKLVSDRVKNSRNFMLFIEYGDIKVLTANGVTRNEVGLSVSVACELNEANNDMLNEAMKMQRGLELMQLILTDMQEESKNCGVLEFATSPIQVMPLDPSLFFGHGGWAASFIRKQTVI